MRRWVWSFWVVAATLWLLHVAGTGLEGQAPPTLDPAGGGAKQVEILTADRVKLKGRYFPCDRDKSPCVLLLHAIGDSSGTKEWTNFAKKLQDQGYAVLMFDFRGHGESTSVIPGSAANYKTNQPAERGFWDETWNTQYVKGYSSSKPRPTEIRQEQFMPAYWTVLANDIAAAKAFLDDQPLANSSNLILIGANDGATLGGLWLNSEFHRFRYVPPAPGQPESLDRQNPEGQAVKAAVWLTISNTLGTSKTPLNLGQMLNLPAKVAKVPMVFAYGEGDSAAAGLAKKVFGELVPAKSRKDYPHSQTMMIAKAEQMSGKKLLLDSLGTADMLIKYLSDVPDSKAAAKPRKASDEAYIWEWYDQARGVTRAVARKKGADRVDFTGYANFLR